MIASGLVLFLCGTAVSAGPFIAPTPTDIVISKNRHSSHNKVTEYYPTSNNSPFITNFIQKGTNVFFKPQFVLSAAQMPPQIQAMVAQIEKDDCKTSYPLGPVPVLPIVEEPLRIIEKELIASPDITEVIEINPMIAPQPIAYPKAPLLIGEPCEIEQIIVPEAPILSTYVPKVVVPVARPIVVEVEESKTPAVIPPAPVLPPLELPKMPMMVDEVPAVAPLPELPVLIEVEEPKDIVFPIMPEAPILPPMDLPKVPVFVEEPCAPAIKVEPVVIPEAPYVSPIIPESFIREVIIDQKPFAIPQPPELPLYSPPELPAVLIEEKIIAEPIAVPEAPVLPPLISMELPAPIIMEEFPVKLEIENEVKLPTVIPAAPVLPPLEIPKMPVLVEEANIIPCPPGEETYEFKPLVIPAAPVLPSYIPQTMTPDLAPVLIEERPIVIPQAPELSPFVMPKLPVAVVVEEKIEANIAAPLPCETVEIVEEHVQPISIPAAPILPPMAPLELPAPVMVEVKKEIVEPVMLSPAPVLSPFVMPVAPVMVPVPCDTVEVVEEHIQSVAIPEAPILPPLEMSAPVIIEEPDNNILQNNIVSPVALPPAPILPPLEISKLEVPVPYNTVEIIEEHVQPMLIPEAPMLSPLAIPAPIMIEEPVQKDFVKPMVLPPAPVLAPLEIPMSPIVVERPAEVVVAPCPPEKEVVIEPKPMKMPFAYSELSLTKPVILPAAPMVSEVYVPQHYAHHNIVKVEKNPLMSFLTSCAEDIVVERALPKMKKALRTNVAKAPVPMRFAQLGNVVL